MHSLIRLLTTSDTNSWKRPVVQGQGSDPRAGHSAVLAGSLMFVFGGGDMRDIFRFIDLKNCM